MPYFATSQVVSASGDNACAWGTPSTSFSSTACSDLHASITARLAELVVRNNASASYKSSLLSFGRHGIVFYSSLSRSSTNFDRSLGAALRPDMGRPHGARNLVNATRAD